MNSMELVRLFLAPEILRGETLSPATDMWQLGILIFYW